MDENDYRLDDPFRLGYRVQTSPEGEIEWIPLTPDDFLDPSPRDEACQDGPHSETLTSLAELLSQHFEDQDGLLAVQMKMIWHIPGLPEPAPDIAIIPGIQEVSPHWGTSMS